ncbi:hypothetical protein TanjilG_09674 [Lupinus angustifolius]|uniref:Uncharacterized protein n=1 Tax=Lupinus angustifolius TaxID=3871 RepID=A0A4P1R448_LUPAN|nr:hypothetical protein TanjilG_09674 [Lupinus angustifolius]
MPLSATALGALLGLSTQMYSNALRKLPYMRHPWEHVVGMGLGAIFVNQLLKWEAQVEKDLDKMLEKAKAANERRYIESQVIVNCSDNIVAISVFGLIGKGIEMVLEWNQNSFLDTIIEFPILLNLRQKVVLLQVQLILSVRVVEVDAQIHG